MLWKFITLEGGEGCGKSTNIKFIEQLLKDQGISVVLTREPGGTVLAENIRQLLLDKEQERISEQTELLMMFAARSQHIKHVIQPALEQGIWVLCDRFTDSSYAYQGGGRGIDSATIAWLENFAQNNIRPDLTLLLDVPVDLGMARAQKRGKLDRFEIEKMEFFNKVRDCFLGIAKQQPERVKVVDAAQELSEVQADITELLQQFIHG
ncbi:MAG: dTMP kinase [Methyloprofundus sp.]|nr:dTMP kinase [Methyloprofundus sp.]